MILFLVPQIKMSAIYRYTNVLSTSRVSTQKARTPVHAGKDFTGMDQIAPAVVLVTEEKEATARISTSVTKDYRFATWLRHV